MNYAAESQSISEKQQKGHRPDADHFPLDDEDKPTQAQP
jgi:hypothetical protein